LVLLTRGEKKEDDDKEVSGSVTFLWKYNARRRKLPAWWSLKSQPALSKVSPDSRSNSDKKDKERETTPKLGRK